RPSPSGAPPARYRLTVNPGDRRRSSTTTRTTSPGAPDHTAPTLGSLLSRPGFRGGRVRLVGFLAHDCGCDRLDPSGRGCFELGRRGVAERLVQPAGAEPAEVFDDGQLGLGAGAPDGAGAQFGV